YCWASSRVFQKLMANTRLGSLVETSVNSSTNPVWFLRIGRALSRIVLQTSRALPLLVVTSTTLVNIEALLSLVGVERESRECRSHSETKLLRLATKLRPPPTPVNDRKQCKSALRQPPGISTGVGTRWVRV